MIDKLQFTEDLERYDLLQSETEINAETVTNPERETNPETEANPICKTSIYTYETENKIIFTTSKSSSPYQIIYDPITLRYKVSVNVKKNQFPDDYLHPCMSIEDLNHILNQEDSFNISLKSNPPTAKLFLVKSMKFDCTSHGIPVSYIYSSKNEFYSQRKKETKI